MKLRFTLLLTVIAFLTLSCQETEQVDDHANWKQRNTDYIADIATKCNTFGSLTPQTAHEGQMFKLLSFKLDPEQEWGVESYVYCEVIGTGTDSISPQYTDSLRINYRVSLIPTDNYPGGEVLDQSFKTQNLDPATNIPASFKVSGLIDGVTTAAMQMHCGDFWRLYIPKDLGYGNKDWNNIPGNSTLIFEINLTEIARVGHDLSPQ